MNSLSQIYARYETIKVEEVGASDAFGYATCRLSNGSVQTVRRPVRGMVVEIINHKADIMRHENCDKFIIKPWKEEPFEMTMFQIHELMENICHSKKDQESPQSSKTSKLKSLLANLRNKLWP